MIYTVKAVRSLQTVACIVGLTLLLWSLGIPTFIRNAEAAALTSVSDTVSDSGRGVVANHTITFTAQNGIAIGQNILLTFPAQFTLPSAGFSFDDLDVSINGSSTTLANTPSGGTWGVATTSSTILITTSGFTVASSSVVTIKIGTNASFQSVGNDQIANPAATGSYLMSIGGSMNGSGSTRVAIVDGVVVTANVDTSLTFTVTGVATSSSVNGAATTTTGSSTATAIPFGLLAPNVSKVMAQDLSVITNASNGFVVTVQQSQNLLSSSGADIDGFVNGAYTNTPTAWVTPSQILSNENTWGHWGLTSEDDLNANEFGTDLWVAASTTPRQIFQNTGPGDGVTANTGATRVGYEAQVSSLQEAGDDYTTTLTYVVTPIF